MSFDAVKADYLRRLKEEDRSKKGSVDEKVVSLIEVINALPQYVTTSSCSGRILLLSVDISGEKFDSEWPFVSHEVINIDSLWSVYSNLSTFKSVWFKMEAPIIHVACDSMSSALNLLKIARLCGFRRPGIFEERKDSVLVEIMGPERIETIVMKDGKKLVDKDYFVVLSNEANEKLSICHAKLKLFENRLKET